ncbi:MAG: GTPase ObgE [bacterium]
MQLIDEVTISAKAGTGGNGVVRWRQEKYIDKGGPNGGDGGRGGDVYIRGIRDVSILARYKAKRSFEAENGEAGMGGSKHGSDGADCIIDVPVGSIVTNKTTSFSFTVLKENEKVIVLRGGQGGLGNEHFKSSTNTTPERATPGREGDEADFHIELELFADVGFVGLPNAGKSSLLNALTNAKAKIGSYQFTTLDPNLGDFYGYILADIPGLIEGASEGKGLGTKFLRHIKRTKMLVHLVSFENEHMMETYKQIRKELEQYANGLDAKDEIILLTKTDVTDEATIKSTEKEFSKLGKPVFVVSLFDDESVKKFSDELIGVLRKNG